MKLQVYDEGDREQFTRRAVQILGAAAQEAVAERGRFLLVLTGGRTVQPVYRFLATEAGHELQAILRERTTFFWSDERWVAPDHPDSNQGLARRLLLDPLGVENTRLMPMSTDQPDPAAGARAYEQRLRDFFETEQSPEGLPVFDLVLLGLGPDGHVASLFPGSSALTETRRWVGKVSTPELTPRVARVTMSLPVLNRARLLLVLAAGSERVKLARRIIKSDPGARACPAARLAAGRVCWLLTEG